MNVKQIKLIMPLFFFHCRVRALHSSVTLYILKSINFVTFWVRGAAFADFTDAHTTAFIEPSKRKGIW